MVNKELVDRGFDLGVIECFIKKAWEWEDWEYPAPDDAVKLKTEPSHMPKEKPKVNEWEKRVEKQILPVKKPKSSILPGKFLRRQYPSLLKDKGLMGILRGIEKGDPPPISKKYIAGKRPQSSELPYLYEWGDIPEAKGPEVKGYADVRAKAIAKEINAIKQYQYNIKAHNKQMRSQADIMGQIAKGYRNIKGFGDLNKLTGNKLAEYKKVADAQKKLITANAPLLESWKKYGKKLDKKPGKAYTSEDMRKLNIFTRTGGYDPANITQGDLTKIDAGNLYNILENSNQAQMGAISKNIGAMKDKGKSAKFTNIYNRYSELGMPTPSHLKIRAFNNTAYLPKYWTKLKPREMRDFIIRGNKFEEANQLNDDAKEFLKTISIKVGKERILRPYRGESGTLAKGYNIQRDFLDKGQHAQFEIYQGLFNPQRKAFKNEIGKMKEKEVMTQGDAINAHAAIGAVDKRVKNPFKLGAGRKPPPGKKGNWWNWFTKSLMGGTKKGFGKYVTPLNILLAVLAMGLLGRLRR